MRATCLTPRPTCSRNWRSRCRRVTPVAAGQRADRLACRWSRRFATARHRRDAGDRARPARSTAPARRPRWASRRCARQRPQVVGEPVEDRQHARRGDQLVLELPHRRPQHRAGAPGPEADADQVDVAGGRGNGRPRHLADQQIARLQGVAGIHLHEAIGEVEHQLDAAVRNDRLGHVEFGLRPTREPHRLDGGGSASGGVG